MEIKGKVEIEDVVDILCDVCGKSCKKDYDFEFAQIFASWGYGSQKDGEQHTCHLCETCYDEVRRFIEGPMNGKVKVNEYL